MKRAILTTIWIFITALIASAQTTFYFPQIADGSQIDGVFWKTTIFLTGSSTATGTITFTTFDASTRAPVNITFVDNSGTPASNGNTIPFTIGPGQSRKYVSTSGGRLAVGYATVSADASISGTAVFSEFSANGILISEAGVPSAAAYTSQLIFVDTQSGFDTGVAYANPNSSPATISLQLLSSQGVAVVSSTQRSLAGNQHNSAFVSQLFSPPPFAGTMQITGDVPLAAVALRFSPAGLFTTLPPVPIAALLYPAIQWAEQRLWVRPFSSLAKLLASLQLMIG